MKDLQSYIEQYDGDDSRISFAWNEKHGDDFEDANLDHRHAVMKVVCANITAVPITLVRDLFRAETRCSKEAWGIHFGASDLANELLKRGGPEYVEDYLEGKFQSFDASMTAGSIGYDLELAESMLAAVREKISSPNDADHLKLLQAGEEIFSGWVENRSR